MDSKTLNYYSKQILKIPDASDLKLCKDKLSAECLGLSHKDNFRYQTCLPCYNFKHLIRKREKTGQIYVLDNNLNKNQAYEVIKLLTASELTKLVGFFNKERQEKFKCILESSDCALESNNSNNYTLNSTSNPSTDHNCHILLYSQYYDNINCNTSLNNTSSHNTLSHNTSSNNIPLHNTSLNDTSSHNTSLSHNTPSDSVPSNNTSLNNTSLHNIQLNNTPLHNTLLNNSSNNSPTLEPYKKPTIKIIKSY